MAPSQPVPVPSQLVWQLIKGNNCFIVNGLHGKKFSSEPGNLYNLHSYKHSGLANEKVVDISAGEDGGVKVSKSRPKHGNKPAAFKHCTIAKKKNFRRTAVNVGKDVGSFRPDLKAAALARVSAVNRSQKAKAAAESKA
ncbi:hypothetical protein WJX81_002197 [Elliptochloris bilobata]|uniref:Ribosomal eL28/Mak16 domain-containing protein n=1 Tax=Elliptochloris bilobata TaxID=381761 RepID=A0AAW1S8Y5_9CHLO